MNRKSSTVLFGSIVIGIVVMRMIRQKNFRWEKGYLALIIAR